jgi:hypothetical protein
MIPLKTSLLAALAAVVVTVGCCYFIQRSRALEAADLRAANEQMRFQVNQRRTAQAPVAVPAAAAAPASGAMPARTSALAEDYRNEGQATPLAALQTIAWACDRGDTATVAQLLYIDPAARVKAEAFLATLPEKTRAQWDSLETAGATIFTADVINYPFPSARILETATVDRISEERVMLRLPDTRRDRTEYQKIGDTWKYVITEALVDAYIAEAKAGH